MLTRPFAVFQRGFERFDDAGTVLVGEQHGILDDFERVTVLFHLVVALFREQIDESPVP